ncbi:MAG TPA: hypothetical protein VMT28_13780 [Terriglobales bacterium]|nr:hypothetical protein [Terriglobales bacterium]
MFEQELEMEKRESSVVPLLLIVTLILAVVAVAGYFVLQARKVITNTEASAIATSVLKAQGPATIRFHTGMVKSSVDDKPHDPNYRLLEKAGLIRLGKDTGAYGTITPVALTLEGQTLLDEIPGVTKSKEKDGTDIYLVPIAERKLVAVSNVKMINPERAVIDYSWKWEPNKLGNLFDASGSMVKSFNTWDRATLIQKYGANFYHGDPTSVSLIVAKDEKLGWQPAIE